MNSVINRVLNGNFDGEVHNDFVKFGRGVFKDKYLIDAKRQKGGIWSIKTSAEFANYLVKSCANENINSNDGSEPLRVTGVIVSTKDLRNELPFPIARVKQFAGVKQAVIDSDIKPSEIIAAIDKFPKAFFALSFSSKLSALKIKPKAPKSAKPSPNEEEKPKASFCTLKTTNQLIVNDLLFDIKEKSFNEVNISHEIEIKNINIPKEISDPVEMREKATREGTIKRKVMLDGNKVSEEEREFAA